MILKCRRLKEAIKWTINYTTIRVKSGNSPFNSLRNNECTTAKDVKELCWELSATQFYLKDEDNRLDLPEQKNVMVLHPFLYKYKQFKHHNRKKSKTLSSSLTDLSETLFLFNKVNWETAIIKLVNSFNFDFNLPNLQTHKINKIKFMYNNAYPCHRY